MAQPNINTTTNEYKFGRGNLMFNPLVGGIYKGFRPFGNCPAFTISVETEKYEHFNSQGGLAQKDLEIVTQINRTASVDCDNLNNANFALFLSAEEVTISQAATPVTDEAITVIGGRSYQLGAISANPSGVRGVSAVTVSAAPGVTRANSTAYARGTVFSPATPNAHYYVVTVAGTSAASPPTFTTDGTTVADGTATIQDLGLLAPANTNNVDYLLDAPLGLLSIVPGGAFAVAAARAGAVGGSLSVLVDYTPAANTREQIRTTGTSELRGQLKFIADNPYGANQDVFFPDVTLAPSGEVPLITENEVASMTLDVGINQLNSTTQAIYIDGRPAIA